MQVDWPFPEKNPAAQLLHTLLAFLSLYFPAGHDWQTLVSTAYVPGGQFAKHVSAPARCPNVLVGHGLHVDAFVCPVLFENVLTGHKSQTLSAVAPEYVPVGQCLHDVAFSAYTPAPHASHAVVPDTSL